MLELCYTTFFMWGGEVVGIETSYYEAFCVLCHNGFDGRLTNVLIDIVLRFAIQLNKDLNHLDCFFFVDRSD